MNMPILDKDLSVKSILEAISFNSRLVSLEKYILTLMELNTHLLMYS